MEINKIYGECCQKTMARLPNRSIDYCITSPPYNISNNSLGKYKEYTDDMKEDEYYENQKKVIKDMLRITKNHIFYNIQMVSGNKCALFRLIGHFYKNIKEVLIWKKYGQPAISEKVFNSSFEYIIIFSNNNPNKRFFEDANFERGTQPNIFTVLNTHFNKYANIHKAVFPLDLPRYFMMNFGKQNDLWYDPYFGTGTTGIGALLEKKRYLGSEISEQYKRLAEKRIKQHQAQLTIF